jgi:hypothetical protein
MPGLMKTDDVESHNASDAVEERCLQRRAWDVKMNRASAPGQPK